LITRRRMAQSRNAVNNHNRGHPQPESALSSGVGIGNRVTHKFSPAGQGTLYPIKLFGIIVLFERWCGCPRQRARSTMNAVIR
jgi:hypothetical protein